MFFFFQAEDGIRDLVRSRGLGDVYKRQTLLLIPAVDEYGSHRLCRRVFLLLVVFSIGVQGAVSYTHLTLPTSDLV